VHEDDGGVLPSAHERLGLVEEGAHAHVVGGVLELDDLRRRQRELAPRLGHRVAQLLRLGALVGRNAPDVARDAELLVQEGDLRAVARGGELADAAARRRGAALAVASERRKRLFSAGSGSFGTSARSPSSKSRRCGTHAVLEAGRS
jgi:hypothetical protein